MNGEIAWATAAAHTLRLHNHASNSVTLEGAGGYTAPWMYKRPTNGQVMKIPVPGQSIPTSDKGQAGKASGQSATNAKPTTQPALNPRQLLDQLQLRQNQETLARVAQVLQKTATAPEQLLLEVRGKSLVVNSDTRLQPGDLVKIMRAGNELRLLGQIQSPATPQAQIAQQLAQHMPWQHRLDQGLAQLARLLQNAPSGTAPQQPSKAPIAEPVRQAIQQLVQQLPTASKLANSSGIAAPPRGSGPGSAIADCLPRPDWRRHRRPHRPTSNWP